MISCRWTQGNFILSIAWGLPANRNNIQSYFSLKLLSSSLIQHPTKQTFAKLIAGKAHKFPPLITSTKSLNISPLLKNQYIKNTKNVIENTKFQIKLVGKKKMWKLWKCGNSRFIFRSEIYWFFFLSPTLTVEWFFHPTCIKGRKQQMINSFWTEKYRIFQFMLMESLNGSVGEL